MKKFAYINRLFDIVICEDGNLYKVYDGGNGFLEYYISLLKPASSNIELPDDFQDPFYQSHGLFPFRATIAKNSNRLYIY